MLEPSLYLEAMASAAIVSAACVLAITALRRPASTTWLNLASIPGIGLGLVTGYHMLAWRWILPPVNGLDRFLIIVVPATLVIELIAGFPAVPRWLAWLLRMSLASMIPRILLHGSVHLSGSNSTPWQAVAVMGIAALFLVISWSLLALLSQRSRGVPIVLALYLATQCAGLTIMMAGYIKGGAAACPLAAILVAAALWTYLAGSGRFATAPSISPAVLGIGIVGLFGLLLIGIFFGRISIVSGLVMLLAPLLCWITQISWLRHRQGWVVGSMGLLLVALPLLIVLLKAKHDFDRDMAPLLGKGKASVLQH